MLLKIQQACVRRHTYYKAAEIILKKQIHPDF